MSDKTPEPDSHMTEMVLATLAGAGVYMATHNLLVSGFAGIVLGIVLSVIKTLYNDRQNRKGR